MDTLDPPLDAAASTSSARQGECTRSFERSSGYGARPRLVTDKRAAPVADVARTSQPRGGRATCTTEPGMGTGRAQNKRATTRAGMQLRCGRRGAARTAAGRRTQNPGGMGDGGWWDGWRGYHNPTVRSEASARQQGCQSLCRRSSRGGLHGPHQEGCVPPLPANSDGADTARHEPAGTLSRRRGGEPITRIPLLFSSYHVAVLALREQVWPHRFSVSRRPIIVGRTMMANAATARGTSTWAAPPPPNAVVDTSQWGVLSVPSCAQGAISTSDSSPTDQRRDEMIVGLSQTSHSHEQPGQSHAAVPGAAERSSGRGAAKSLSVEVGAPGWITSPSSNQINGS